MFTFVVAATAHVVLIVGAVFVAAVHVFINVLLLLLMLLFFVVIIDDVFAVVVVARERK